MLTIPEVNGYSIPQICLYLQGYTNLSPGQQESKMQSWGFKTKCMRTLATALGVSTSRIAHWGKGLNFPKMPPLQLARLIIVYLQQQLADRDQVIREQRRYIVKLQNQLENQRNFRRTA